MESMLDPWQFRLSRVSSPNAISVGKRFLETGDGLNVLPITDNNGSGMGLLLGFPIDLSKKEMVHGSYIAPSNYEGNPDEFADEVFEELGGRFLWIFEADGISRIYVDCSAQVPCVFDKENQLIGSTAHAILTDEEYERRFDRELYAVLDVEKEGWFPGGLTAHHGIERVLPNHYLDLSRFETKRHWPTSDIDTSADPHKNVTEIITLVQNQIEAVTKESKKAGLALTAGRETRMLLACARGMIEQIDFVTVVGTDGHTTDTVIARKIARDLSLNHTELPRISAEPHKVTQYMRRGGHCIGDANAIYHPSVHPISRSHIFIGGAGGEVARAFFWKKSDDKHTELTADSILNRLGLPKHPRLLASVEKWRSGIGSDDAEMVLDLLYIENRMGPWYGAQFYNDPTLVRLAPLVTRKAIRLMTSLPAEWKLEQRITESALEAAWPELKRYPFNSLGKGADFLMKIQKVYKNPSLILKKIRRMRN